ncbi:MAG: TOMM precursor leader peptide-binding protein [Microcystis aeruginosa Ma_QC_Ch_20071001_S25]|jgi:ribosomal protein S12 methylthiotransferase accessory factor|uniref:YcaO domain-containing protein n=2 Tax=Microcystis aeruginosa TaxID=1126 RepID=A0A822LBS3_MICAE|nr:TOMM precursor leader peptide-binding protein [Microcystis aeruginosa]TRT97049.1 MAG: TOMM precursor leader peptide-binding protein [Microcystis aeruginosa Ma_OC_LR_19540900_S633]TRU44444.1 MAG: TOMM precursor leader peptide-binding protein [Microcystis aeruginosa Ma_QC_Ch_20071001_S25D]TRU51517.1 MAG: TOMM precursor leader peptide-binding protein [Microcystis aeruginosa Ma_QC_Ch_20071001_S25]TRU64441.1 MAG: TOMM precursor leader peptide-binding protein [Microcystis aeruginosa Ma_QC_Ch_20071
MQSTPLLQIQPHFHVEVIEPKQVYLLGEQANYALTGQLYCQILPLLDGQHNREQIVEKLDGEVPEEYIDYVLERLAEKGYLTEAAPELSSEVAAFWSELGIAPPVAAEALRQPVTLTPVGNISEVTVAALTTALRDIGISVQTPTEAGSPTALNVVLTDDYLQPELAKINKQALESQQTWLLVKPVGSVLWLGPVFVPGKTGCWDCLAHRLRGNREVEASVLQQKQAQQQRNGQSGSVIGCLPTARATLPSTLQTGLQFAATEIAKCIVKHHVNATAPGTVFFPTLDGKIITLNHSILDLKSHILIKRSHCSTCGDRQILHRQGFEPVKLVSRPKHFTHDGGHRAFTPEQTVQKYQHLVSPITGVVTELVRITDPANPLVHTYKAGHAFGSATSLRGLRNTLKHKSSGKGKTDSQSKASGLCEAVERYSGIFQGDEPRKRATLEELGDLAIHPEQCLCFSDAQYANRDTLNEQATVAHDWIPQRFDASQAIEWTPVWSLTEQTHKYLPTALCYYHYPLPPEHRFARGDSNGNAAGNTLEEAILQGFMELVERDGVALWWYNRLRRPAVDLGSFNEPYFVQLQQFYRENDRDLWVLDLTADLGIPAFAGVSNRKTGSSERLILGFGAHLDPTIAILRAVTEVNQIGLELDKVPDENLKSDATDWLITAKLADHPYLLPDTTQPLKTAQDYPKRWSDDIYTDVMTCVNIAQQAGLETLVIDQTRPDIGLNVVKVTVPGMRHFWSRFGVGRLYDVPVKLGWRDEPLTEAQMNPTPMPF